MGWRRWWLVLGCASLLAGGVGCPEDDDDDSTGDDDAGDDDTGDDDAGDDDTGDDDDSGWDMGSDEGSDPIVTEAILIDPTNTGDPDEDGSEEHPFDSWADVAWVDGGIYLQKRGTVANEGPIVYDANNVTLGAYGDGQRPDIVSSAQQSDNQHALGGWQRGGVTIENLDIDAPDAVSVLYFNGGNGTGNTVDNCDLHGAGWGIRMTGGGNAGHVVTRTEIHDIDEDGVFAQDVDGVEFGYCYVHDVNQNWVPPYTSQDEAGGDGIQFSDCDHWHVHHCVLDRTNSGNKFCFISNGAGQTEGLFEHNRLTGPLPDGDGGASIYFGSGANLVVRYNVIAGPSPTGIYHHTDNLSVIGNVFVDLPWGLNSLSDSTATVVHNTFVDIAGGPIDGDDVVVHNNLFDLGAVEPDLSGVGTLVESHNLYAVGAGGTNSVLGDPLFVDRPGGDYHLQPGSPAIDAGTDAGVTEDMDGTGVPQGSAPDIGAFEAS